MTNWYVGMMVECINDRWPPHPMVINYPVFRMVYTIRGLRTSRRGHQLFSCIVLEELINPQPNEVHFLSKHFRPIQKPNIDILRQLLVPF